MYWRSAGGEFFQLLYAWKHLYFAFIFFLKYRYSPWDLFIYVFFFFWLCHTACGILVHRPGIEPVPLAVEAWCLNHWTTREVPILPSFLKDTFTGYRILGWQYFSFSSLKMLFHFFLTFIIPDEKFSGVFISLYTRSHFPFINDFEKTDYVLCCNFIYISCACSSFIFLDLWYQMRNI